MEVITIENQAFSQLLTNMNSLLTEIRLQNQKCNSKTDPIYPTEKLTEGDQWCNTAEVCKILKVSKRTVQNLRDKFILPYTRVGRKILFRLSDVNKLLEKNYVTINDP
jgi:excisionase family DNA binding protein